ncbi:MAG: hypothetical protein F4Z05_06055 [Chloroflexi bacterium]|nr:hypothetical protein [Chloroflexota bacterium]
MRSPDVRRKSGRSPSQVMVTDLVGCATERARAADESEIIASRRAVREAANQLYSAGRRREEAAEAPSAHQPQREERAKRVSRSAGGNERPEFLAEVPVPVCHLLGKWWW